MITEEAIRHILGIKFTFDIPDKHQDRKCPFLNLAVWMEKDTGSGNLKIHHTFYEKAETAPTVFHSKTAYN